MFEKRPVRALFFVVSCLFVYGGAVNLGFSDFFMAIPFAVFIIFAAIKWKKEYILGAVALVALCTPLYILKKSGGPLFYPAIGKDVITSDDICLSLHEGYEGSPGFVIGLNLADAVHKDCNLSNLSGTLKSQILPKGTHLKIEDISVSTSEFSENYRIHTQTPLGLLKYSVNPQHGLVWPDGTLVEESDLRNGIFYYPSMLMAWPVLPVLVLSIIK